MNKNAVMKINYYFIALTIIAIVVFSFEIRNTLRNPIAFGDSAYHAYIGKYIGENREFPKILPAFNSNYTYSPLFHLTLGIFYMTSYGEILTKLFLPLVSVATGLLMFKYVSQLYSQRTALIASALFLSTPIIVTYSVLIYTDMLMVMFFTLCVLFVMMADRLKSMKYWVLAVVFACFSYLTKGVGVASFIFLMFVIFYNLIRKEITKKEFFRYASILVLVSLAILSGWFARNWVNFRSLDCNLPVIRGSCRTASISPESLKMFVSDVAPRGSNADLFSFGITNFLEFSYGWLWFMPLFSVCGIIFVYRRREKFDIFLLALIIILVAPVIAIHSGLTGAGFSLRTEDFARYFILAVPVFSMLSAVFLESLCVSLAKYWKYLFIVVILIILAGSWVNFKRKVDSMMNVLNFSPMFFQACNFIKASTSKDATLLTLWGAPTAYNCERSSVWATDYLPDIVLSNDLTTALNALKSQNVDYVFVQKFALSSVPYLASVPLSFVQFLESNPDSFVKIYENGPSLQDCIYMGGCDGSIVYKVVW